MPTQQTNFVWRSLREQAAEFAVHCERRRVIARPFSDVPGGGTGDDRLPAENEQSLSAARSWSGSAPR